MRDKPLVADLGLQVDELDSMIVAHHKECVFVFREHLHAHGDVASIHASYLDYLTVRFKSSHEIEVVVLEDRNEELVSFVLDEICDHHFLQVLIVQNSQGGNASTSCALSHEEETIVIGNCKISASLTQPCLAALRESF